MIGSFAYICVTIFFLVSAFGMMHSVNHKPDYLKHFWRNRLVSLLIPNVLVNILFFGLSKLLSREVSVSALYYLNNYVAVLLVWCVWFYVVEICKARFFKGNTKLEDALLIAGVALSSLSIYFLVGDDEPHNIFNGWPYERIGLVWGVLLYRYFDIIVAWMGKRRSAKVVVLLIVGGIFGVAYLKYKVIYFWGAYLLKIALGFVLILLLFTSTSSRQFSNKASLWLGNISYEVYLSHALVMHLLAMLVPADFNSGAFILLTVVTTIIISKAVQLIANPIVLQLKHR